MRYVKTLSILFLFYSDTMPIESLRKAHNPQLTFCSCSKAVNLFDRRRIVEFWNKKKGLSILENHSLITALELCATSIFT